MKWIVGMAAVAWLLRVLRARQDDYFPEWPTEWPNA